jgi:hypothetical protein
MSKAIPIIYADDPNFKRLLKEGKVATGVDDWLHKRRQPGYKHFPPEKIEDDDRGIHIDYIKRK